MAVKEHESEEARTEAAVDLSLGLLEPSESERLKEHLRSGCAPCEAEVLSFAHVAGALAVSADAVAPPPRLRERLLQTVVGLSASGDKGGMQAWQVVRTPTLPWQPAKRKGIWEKSLFHDPVRHRSTRLIRMEPGAEIPAHRHLGEEETLVLEGTGELGGFPFGPGDYQRAHSGSLHPSYITKEGCVFLLFSGTEYEFPTAPLEPSSSEQFMTVRSGVGPWTPVRPGLDAQALFSASMALLATTTLVRLKAGGAVSSSEFSISEAYFLKGHAYMGSTELSAGDYLRATESGQSVEFQSQQGCTLLIRSGS
jgi:hypothetical protein